MCTAVGSLWIHLSWVAKKDSRLWWTNPWLLCCNRLLTHRPELTKSLPPGTSTWQICEPHGEKSRFEEADEAAREAVAELHELEGRIVRTRAKTPTGMLVKARMAALDPATVSTMDETWNRPSRRGWKQATSSGFRSSSTCWTCTEAMRRQQRAVYSLLLYRT